MKSLYAMEIKHWEKKIRLGSILPNIIAISSNENVCFIHKMKILAKSQHLFPLRKILLN